MLFPDSSAADEEATLRETIEAAQALALERLRAKPPRSAVRVRCVRRFFSDFNATVGEEFTFTPPKLAQVLAMIGQRPDAGIIFLVPADAAVGLADPEEDAPIGPPDSVPAQPSTNPDDPIGPPASQPLPEDDQPIGPPGVEPAPNEIPGPPAPPPVIGPRDPAPVDPVPGDGDVPGAPPEAQAFAPVSGRTRAPARAR